MQEGHFLTANIITANIFIRKNFKLYGIYQTNPEDLENLAQVNVEIYNLLPQGFPLGRKLSQFFGQENFSFLSEIQKKF
jgi:hypothetical protein